MPSLLNTVKDLERLRQIVGVLARHGFGEIVQRTALGSLLPGSPKKVEAPKIAVGERIRLVLEELGPCFIKLGQVVSTRPDVIPEEIIRELRKLQDECPPVAFPEIKDQVEQELGMPLGEVYVEFDETPMASASIGQVHRAKLKTDGESIEVVAKVQRPNVKDIMERDIDLLYWLAHAIERSIPESRLYNPVKLVGEFDRAVTAELNFQLEADNAERFSTNFTKVPYCYFPKVHRSASSKRVITLELLKGKKIQAAVAAGASGELIAKRSVAIIVQQIFEDGFFHADPHPGNVLILGENDDPTIAMIDLGLVGRLTPRLRDRVIDLMVAAIREDFQGMADALYAIGRPVRKVDRRAFEAEVAVLAEKYLGKKLEEIELSGLIRDLAYGARTYGIEIPPDFLLLGKALMTVEGVGKEIYPALDVFQEVKPYFLRLLQQRYSPERMTQDLMRSVVRITGAANEMPLQLQEILEDLRKGSFRVTVQEADIASASDRLGRRIFSGMVTASLLVSSAILATDEQYWLAAGAVVAAGTYAFWHTALVFVLNRRSAAAKARGDSY